MKCPVCEVELKFPVQELDEVYYDCSNCDTSLVFKNGECEVLNEGRPEDVKPQDNLSEKTISEEDSSQKNVIEENVEEKSQSESLPSEGSLSQNFPTEKNAEQHEVGGEPLQADNEEKLADEDSPHSQQDDQLKEESPEEEEFVPDETTQVPELESSEQDTSESFAEQEEDPESPVKEESPEPSVSQEDFPFKEEAVGETSSEQQDFESQKEEPQKTSEKEDFSEVAEFGNTQDQDRQGPFLYDLILSEINSEDVREKVLSILEDEYLNLPLNKEDTSIKDTIRDGKLTIVKISPVQAYIIVTFLMGLPLEITWRQHHIAEGSTTN